MEYLYPFSALTPDLIQPYTEIIHLNCKILKQSVDYTRRIRSRA